LAHAWSKFIYDSFRQPVNSVHGSIRLSHGDTGLGDSCSSYGSLPNQGSLAVLPVGFHYVQGGGLGLSRSEHRNTGEQTILDYLLYAVGNRSDSRLMSPRTGNDGKPQCYYRSPQSPRHRGNPSTAPRGFFEVVKGIRGWVIRVASQMVLGADRWVRLCCGSRWNLVGKTAKPPPSNAIRSHLKTHRRPQLLVITHQTDIPPLRNGTHDTP
jgi:hypothetical protein